jgi:hypothetical protein
MCAALRRKEASSRGSRLRQGDDLAGRGSLFSSGTVAFGDARFSGAKVDFDSAWFSGGDVDFRGVKFSSGTVDLSNPSDWSTPPKFFWTETPPPGVKLPHAGEANPAST